MHLPSLFALCLQIPLPLLSGYMCVFESYDAVGPFWMQAVASNISPLEVIQK